MNNSSDRNNIKLGMMLSYVIMIVSLIGTLFISNKLLRYIGDYNFGLYSFVNSITSWLTVVSSALTASYLRFASLENKNCDSTGRTNSIYFKILLYLSLIIVLVLFAVISFFYFNKINFGKYDWTDSSTLYILFYLSVFNIGLTLPFSVFTLYINFNKKFIFARIVSIVITIFTFLGQFVIAYYFKNIILLSCYSIIITLFTSLLNYVFCKKQLNITFFKTNLFENKELLRNILLFSGVLLLNSVVDQVNNNVDKTLLGFFSVPDDVALYQVGQQFDTYLISMSISVSGVFAPTIHSLCLDNNKNGINDIFNKISKLQILIVVFFTFGFVSCGKEFVSLWIGPERINAYYVATVLMIIDICPLTINSSIEIQRAQNKHVFRAFMYFGVAILNVFLSILFLKIFDIKYAIFACLMGSIISRVISHWIAMNVYNHFIIGIDMKYYVKRLCLYLLIGVVSVLSDEMLYRFIPVGFSGYLIPFFVKGITYVLIFGILVFIIDRKYILYLIKNVFKR